MGKKMLLLVVLVAFCLCGSAALAGGPLGPPMSLLDHGQWAFDVGYFYEEMDLHGCYEWSVEGEYYWWYYGEYGIYDYGYMGRGKVWVKNFETNTWMGSIEYGLCDNWDVFLRLGMADAKGDVEYKGLYGGYHEYWGPECGLDYDEDSADFGYGFAWQVGTAFTICESGPWTFGGRMQVGFAYPDEWDDSGYYYADYGEYVYEDRWKASVDLEWWQALGYVGANYQLNDALHLYGAGGWQTLHAEIEAKESGSSSWSYVYPRYEEETYEGKGSSELKHGSAIGVFGALWAPNDKYNVAVDCLVGEAGKWGIGVYGLIAF